MPEIKILLDDLLKSHNMTQSKLSELTGIRTESIGNLRKNKNERITLDHLARIMKALELNDIGDILQYIPDDPKADYLEEPIEMLDLSPRTFNAIKRMPFRKINTIGDLIAVDFSNPLYTKTARLGPVALDEIERCVKIYLDKHK